MQNKTTEIVNLLTTVFTGAVKRDNHLEKQQVTNEVLRVLHSNGVTLMADTHPAIDLVFSNISELCELETSNAWSYKINH